jgi:hypothetical protein
VNETTFLAEKGTIFSLKSPPDFTPDSHPNFHCQGLKRPKRPIAQYKRYNMGGNSLFAFDSFVPGKGTGFFATRISIIVSRTAPKFIPF